MSSTKEVLVWRADLKVRKGKYGAQISHAAMAFMAKMFRDFFSAAPPGALSATGTLTLTEAQREWLLDERFTKIVAKVNSEAELMQIHDAAVAAGLDVHLITDAGATEFHGIPTRTCLSIGPDEVEKINAVTGHLELF